IEAKTPRISMPSTPEAEDLLGVLYDRVEGDKDDGFYSNRYHRPFGGRVAEQACRLATIIELAWDPKSREVGAAAMARAIKAVEFFEAQYRTLFGSSAAVLGFAAVHIEESPKGEMVRSEVHPAFLQYCEQKQLPTMG